MWGVFLAARDGRRPRSSSLCISELLYRLKRRYFYKKKECESPQSTRLRKCARTLTNDSQMLSGEKPEASWGQRAATVLCDSRLSDIRYMMSPISILFVFPPSIPTNPDFTSSQAVAESAGENLP